MLTSCIYFKCVLGPRLRDVLMSVEDCDMLATPVLLAKLYGLVTSLVAGGID